MKIALLSVWDKTGLVDLAQKLTSAGWRLIASGGTARALEDAGLAVTPVTEITGQPEMFAGRVKTLHPAIHAGLLARDTKADRADLAAQGWNPIDLVVVNLYPFEDITSQPDTTLETAIEHIDIGGVALLRAAAKNYQRVTVISNPSDYPDDVAIFDEPGYRQRMALKAFTTTAHYDEIIQAYFADLLDEPSPLQLTLYPVQTLRYGENPHQQAAYYTPKADGAPMGGELLQGKPLSYNNLLDLDGAWRTALSFDEAVAVVVKHTSPCGVATAPHAEQAIGPAIASDPVSAFGSVIASNREINAAFVKEVGDLFVECIAAPGFSSDALDLLTRKGNLRLLQIPLDNVLANYELRSVVGGFLRQSIDRGDPAEASAWRVATKRQPNASEMEALRFSWKAVQFVKSNAVLLAKVDGEFRFTVGIGGGQPNRVDCVRMAGQRAGERAAGSVMASDAFFPFPDGVQVAAQLGITAVVQPGGSVNDEQVITAADELGMAMVFTGVRHFRH
ncbi:MAG: bifunctional phosphoribosylaminoimidazolecarboxamide formyltransferase/IMP cyclohydrolase [Chloroflexota bacterium]|nr:bifunctional phosphoribosylaminoimidazolecarboxamide formyltransferase/IMP cyclohydrolase [Chloroflexota bacterium]